MTISRQIGEGPQAGLLRYILKQLERITAVASKISTNPGLTLTADEVDAIQDATNPSATNVFATIANISIKKDYRVILTQTGTTAPIATILEDDISSPVWSYSSVGVYLLTKTGAFIINKTLPSNIVGYTDPVGNYMTLERTSADVMTLKTYAAVNMDEVFLKLARA